MDNVDVARLQVNDRFITFCSFDRFTYQEHLSSGGSKLTIVAIDRAGLKSKETIRLNRGAA